MLMDLDEKESPDWWIGCGKKAWLQEQFWMYLKLTGKILMLDECPCCHWLRALGEDNFHHHSNIEIFPIPDLSLIKSSPPWRRRCFMNKQDALLRIFMALPVTALFYQLGLRSMAVREGSMTILVNNSICLIHLGSCFSFRHKDSYFQS
ncbi:hypothetical protein TNCV_4270181 [Trichonephila clavipes]|nr:hypothetical protein TNCV_4270181 [Trichonephila clavipes]